METCFHHTGRETGRRCTRCGRPACPDCLRDAAVGAQCWECIKAARPPASERVRRAWRADPVLVTKAIVALNVAAFVYMGIRDRSLQGGIGGSITPSQARWGVDPIAIAQGEWWRLVTAGFVHFGLIHLGMNMIILYRVGLDIEDALGKARFALLYFACLLAGSLGGLLVTRVQGTYTLGGGASGAVFGVAGAAFVALRQRGVRFGDTMWGPLLLINIVLGFVVENVGWGAHLGGLAAGAVIGSLMLHPFDRRRRTAAVPVAILIGIASFAGSLLVTAPYHDCNSFFPSTCPITR